MAGLSEDDCSFLGLHVCPDMDGIRKFDLALDDLRLKRGLRLYDLCAFCKVVACLGGKTAPPVCHDSR
jgi:hypothetical protein